MVNDNVKFMWNFKVNIIDNVLIMLSDGIARWVMLDVNNWFYITMLGVITMKISGDDNNMMIKFWTWQDKNILSK